MTLPHRRPLAGLATIGVVALIAGCGGGGSDTLSASDFRKQADAICADYNTRAAAVGDPSSPSEYAAKLAQLVPLQAAQVAKLKALKPPSDLKATYDEALALLDKQQATLKSAETRITGGEDPTAVLTSISKEASDTGSQADAKAKALGLTVCGTDNTATGSGTTSTTATAPATTAPATTAPATTSGTSTGTVSTADYVKDVQAAATALSAFGTALQSSTGVADLKSKVPAARQDLDQFDAAIAKLGGYQLGIAKLDQQREGLLRTGPKVSDVLRRFLDAAAAGDLGAVTKLLPEVQSTIGEFQQAATVS